MAENTKIEWTHHSFNPWEGCAKVSPGCKNCYAEAQHNFLYSSLGKDNGPGTCWGVKAPRLGRSDDYWAQPLKWNEEAKKRGVRLRVFCASMADVFEEQSPASAAHAGSTAMVPTGPETKRLVYLINIQEERFRLFALIHQTPHLDWLLLTKRPDNILPVLAALGRKTNNRSASSVFGNWLRDWEDGSPPANVWLGTSVENQATANERIPHLLKAPSAIRFLSCEPLLGPVDLQNIVLEGTAGIKPAIAIPALTGWYGGINDNVRTKINWVIVGGESGHGARPIHPDWALALRDQCERAKVAFFFKQWGEWAPFEEVQRLVKEGVLDACYLNATAKKQGIWEATTGEFLAPPPAWALLGKMAYRIGKTNAGRLLDGRQYDQFPKPNNF